MIKKLIIALIILVLIPQNALALNTYTTDLEKTSSQFWSITDVAQTGLDITGDITIEAWVKLEELPVTGAGNNYMIVTKRDDTSTEQYTFDAYYAAANDIRLRFIYNSNGTVDNANRTLGATNGAVFTSSDVGVWVHVAVTADVSEATILFYKDTAVATTTHTLQNATSIADSNGAFRIGAINDTSASFVDGLVDDVRVWNDIRTPTEIADNYACSLAGTEDNLVGYWRFDNDGTDSTSNSNDLTNNNSATFQTASLPFTATCATPPVETVTPANIIMFNP